MLNIKDAFIGGIIGIVGYKAVTSDAGKAITSKIGAWIGEKLFSSKKETKDEEKKDDDGFEDPK